MNDLKIEEQIDEKAKIIISKMEKELELKDKEIRFLNKNKRYSVNPVSRWIAPRYLFLTKLKNIVIQKWRSQPLKK